MQLKLLNAYDHNDKKTYTLATLLQRRFTGIKVTSFKQITLKHPLVIDIHNTHHGCEIPRNSSVKQIIISEIDIIVSLLFGLILFSRKKRCSIFLENACVISGLPSIYSHRYPFMIDSRTFISRVPLHKSSYFVKQIRVVNSNSFVIVDGASYSARNRYTSVKFFETPHKYSKYF